MGLSYSQAIVAFNNMIVLNNELPFEIKIPTKDIQKALEEFASGKGRKFKTTDELFQDLLEDDEL